MIRGSFGVGGFGPPYNRDPRTTQCTSDDIMMMSLPQDKFFSIEK